MRASTETLLSLFEYAQIMGINPWEMAQFSSPTDHSAQCQSVWYQYQYQQDFLSREEVASTIAAAEAAIADHLGFWPAPKYLEQTVDIRRPYHRMLYGSAGTPRGQWKTLSLNYGHVVGGGTLAREQIATNAAVVRSDPDGDGVNERFTVTVATAVTEPYEIGVYFRSADRLGEALDETWRIRPVTVSIADGTATITGHSALLVPPAKTTVANPDELSHDDEDNYVAAVEVHRVYRDTTATDDNPAQGYALWEALPENPDATNPIAQTTRAIAIGERLMEAGQVYAAYADPGACSGWREPDRVRVKYLAGFPMIGGRMARTMAEIVAHLATGWLPAEKCGCERSSRIISHWREMPAQASDGTTARPLTIEEVNNPFGATRGALWAWKRVQALTINGYGSL